MNETIDTQAKPAVPTWRRVIAFPLVAMVLAILALALTFGVVGFALNAAFAGLARTPSQIVNGIVATILVIAFGKLVLSRLGEDRRDDFAWPGSGRQFGAGLAGSFVLMSAIVGVVWLLGGYGIDGAGGATSWAMLIFVAGLQAGFLEELIFRGILFRFLEQFGGSWFALGLTAALFGGVHLSNENATTIGALGIAVSAGLLLGGASMLARSLWLPVALHAGWNVAQGLVWDVPVSGNQVDGMVEAHHSGPVLISGGMFGVEASVVAMVLAGAAGAWLIVLAARRGLSVRPWGVRRRLAHDAA